MRLYMEVKPALCPAHRSLLPDGKQLILYSSTALSQSLPCLFLDRGLSTPPPSLPCALHPPFPGRMFPIFWERIPYRLGNIPRYSMRRTMYLLFLIFY